MLDQCQPMDASVEASALLSLEPLGFQRAVHILRDMKIENPTNADMMEALIVRLEGLEAVVDASQAAGPRVLGHGNIFEDILNKIIAKAEEDPVKVAKIIIGIFVPLGKGQRSMGGFTLTGNIQILPCVKALNANPPNSHSIGMFLVLNAAMDFNGTCRRGVIVQ